MDFERLNGDIKDMRRRNRGLGLAVGLLAGGHLLALVVILNLNRTPFGGRHEATMSVIHGRPVRSLATNREPAVGG